MLERGLGRPGHQPAQHGGGPASRQPSQADHRVTAQWPGGQGRRRAAAARPAQRQGRGGDHHQYPTRPGPRPRHAGRAPDLYELRPPGGAAEAGAGYPRPAGRVRRRRPPPLRPKDPDPGGLRGAAVRVAVPSLTPAAGLGAVSVAGLGFLLLRPGLEGLGPGARSAVLAAGYLSLAAGAGGTLGRGRTSPRATASPRPALLPAWATLAAGLLAVAAAARMAGPAPPLAGGGAALTLGLLAAVAEEA